MVFWKRSVKSAFGGPKYSMTKLTKAVKGQLPPKTLLEIGAVRDNPKVAVLSLETSRNKRVLFCSYTPCSNDPNTMYIVNTQLYFAATATSAIPTYLRAVKGVGQLKFVDGGVITNNPAVIGMEEAKRIWSTEADILMSLGGGIKPTFKQSQATPESMFEWINKFAEVTENSECTHQELDMRHHSPDSTVYYARFDPPMTYSVSLDSATQDMSQLEIDTIKYIQDNEQKLQDMAKMLLAKRKLPDLIESPTTNHTSLLLQRVLEWTLRLYDQFETASRENKRDHSPTNLVKQREPATRHRHAESDEEIRQRLPHRRRSAEVRRHTLLTAH